MKKAYLAIKFRSDYSDKEWIEQLSDSLKAAGIETIVMVRDQEKWGEQKFSPKKLMDITFREIDASDMIIIEFSEKGVGLGIEAGYAFAKGKPIIVISKTGSDISSTLAGIAERVVFYDVPAEVGQKVAG